MMGRSGRCGWAAATVGAMLALGVSAANAAPPGETPKQNKAPDDTTVSGVTVTASTKVPKVSSTFPAQGASVAPGVLVLRVSFDQPMLGESWSYVTGAGGDYPDCADAPRRLDDRKSFVLICRTMPKKTYALWFNREPYQNFVSLMHKPASSYLLKFTTSDADPVWTLVDAMKLDAALPPGANPAEPEGKRKPGETVDTEASDPPPGSVPGSAPSKPS